MQKVKAISRFVRISPYKARRAADLIRNMKVEDALLESKYSTTKGARLLLKTLDSAIANAETQIEARKENLKIHEIRVDDGPIIKRSKARNKGGQSPILKRTSHFTIVLMSE